MNYLGDNNNNNSNINVITKSAVGSKICEFLIILTHHIVKNREIYPEGIFKQSKYNEIPVYMSIHPELNQYIDDAIRAMQSYLIDGEIRVVAIQFRNEEEEIVECFEFEIKSILSTSIEDEDDIEELEIYFVDCIFKIGCLFGSLSALPNNCTFSIECYTTNKNIINKIEWVRVYNKLNPNSFKTIQAKALKNNLIDSKLIVKENIGLKNKKNTMRII
eukprot:TRINITY_DN3752_c1_g1_i2.p1 TRINITY_DN3752_c1_g1~~TRINITY_DN3752_c1_g1_i2.p1  ORF type:complete len:218 (-),score=26.04 TRINITY_DN3752_c1_g1_i2:229-882(-)